MEQWGEIAAQMYFPYSDEHQIYLQQDGFLDKQRRLVSIAKVTNDLSIKMVLEIRILRSPYIKQADASFRDFISLKITSVLKNLNDIIISTNSFTVHESSLNSVFMLSGHKLGKMDQAYAFYLRTSPIDLDDYNKEVEEGFVYHF